jgi:hypothetical protein
LVSTWVAQCPGSTEFVAESNMKLTPVNYKIGDELCEKVIDNVNCSMLTHG